MHWTRIDDGFIPTMSMYSFCSDTKNSLNDGEKRMEKLDHPFSMTSDGTAKLRQPGGEIHLPAE